MTRFVALLDGRPGGYGVAFPDCPGCTAMGRTPEEAIDRAGAALAEWIAEASREGIRPTPSPIAALRDDAEVREALADGAALVIVPLALELAA